MTFEEFHEQAQKQRFGARAWLREPGIALYVRRAIVPGADYDLANMDAAKPGNGALTRFLDKYEPRFSFYVECVHNPRLVKYLERRGYTHFTTPGLSPHGAPNMLKLKEVK